MDSSMKNSEVPVKSEEREVVTFTTIRYRECHRNHLVSIGGYAIDGCMEFMASGAEGTSAALTCHACGCHRNFHKKEIITEVVCESSAAPPNGAT